jgi:hypothetical protein
MRTLQEWEDLFTELLDQLEGGRTEMRPFEKGLKAVANDGFGPSLTDKITARQRFYRNRRDALDSVSTAVRTTKTAIDALVANGYPDTPPWVLDASERAELLGDVANIEAVANLVSGEQPTTQVEITADPARPQTEP